MPTDLLDTTLREGEQRFGVFFPRDVKVKLASELRSHVRFIEIGSPTYCPTYRRAAEDVLARVPRDQVIVQCVLDAHHMRTVLDMGAKWIGVFVAIRSDLHELRYGHRVAESMNRIHQVVTLCKQQGCHIRLTCEDASRTNLDELITFYRSALQLGVESIGFADTVGVLDPHKTRIYLQAIHTAGIPLSKVHVHFHNDTGFADENAELSRELGVGCISATLLGIGERVGISNLSAFSEGNLHPLEELLRQHINPKEWSDLRFAHKAGLHIDGVLKHPLTYEWTSPETVGCRRTIILSKLSGLAAVRYMLGEIAKADPGSARLPDNESHLLEVLKSKEFLEMTTPNEFAAFVANPEGFA